MRDTISRVDLRCPEDPRSLLGRVRDLGGKVSSENLMEIQCRSCSRNSKQVDPSVTRVVHCFDFSGALVESFVERH